jgi:hypothetical protein
MFLCAARLRFACIYSSHQNLEHSREHTQLNSTQLNSTQLNSTQLNSTHFSAAPVLFNVRE